MIKRYKFENPANNTLMAEILTRRDHLPRMTFLSALTAVMVAAVSLTAVCGGLSAGAIPFEQQAQTDVSSNTDAEILPPEIVTRVHTETQIEPVAVYNDSALSSETLLLPDAGNAEYPDTGKALFDQKQQRYQWQYGDEIFTFFVKNNTLYRRSETSGKTTAVYSGDGDVSLFCVTDRYLFFRADTRTTDVVFCGYTAYCYRADLLTGEVLRLFYCDPYGYQTDPDVFVRFDGTDVIFTHYIVHEDGSYERIPDKPKTSYTEDETNSNTYDDTFIKNISVLWNNDNTISAKDSDGNCYDLGISVKDLESLGYEIDTPYESVLWHNKQGDEYIYVLFNKIQYDYSCKRLWYYGKITDNGLEGGLIQTELSNLSDRLQGDGILITDFYVLYDNSKEFIVPIDFDKLTAATPSEPEYHSFDDGNAGLTITYYPCNALNAATADSAEK